MMTRKMLLSGWGRQRWIETALVTTDDLPRSSRDASLSRGLGRAYGDAALLLGISDTACKYLIPEFGAFYIYAATLGVLLWRPRGLFAARA